MLNTICQIGGLLTPNIRGLLTPTLQCRPDYLCNVKATSNWQHKLGLLASMEFFCNSLHTSYWVGWLQPGAAAWWSGQDDQLWIHSSCIWSAYSTVLLAGFFCNSLYISYWLGWLQPGASWWSRQHDQMSVSVSPFPLVFDQQTPQFSFKTNLNATSPWLSCGCILMGPRKFWWVA